MADNNLTKLLLGFDDIAPHPELSREDYKRAAWNMPGSKFKSLHHILPELPYRAIWIEGCVGTGVITLNRRESPLEILNDRHAGIVAFYRAVRDPILYDRLLARLKVIVYSREEFIWCRDTWENCEDDVERAARWYYMIRSSFNQIGRNWGRSNKGEAMLPNKYWRGLKAFPHIHHRIHKAQVENMDVIQLVKDYDSHETVGYIDPDYVDTDPGVYQHGVNHKKLIETILDSKGFYAVSSYANSLYDGYDWTRVKRWDVDTSIKAQAFKETNNLKDFSMERHQVEECLYIKDFR